MSTLRFRRMSGGSGFTEASGIPWTSLRTLDVEEFKLNRLENLRLLRLHGVIGFHNASRPKRMTRRIMWQKAFGKLALELVLFAEKHGVDMNDVVIAMGT
mmetsp:Transcript_56239/g.138138  ORF Transcript_56239/g.138138 Transcript_56239/m.138138 type:complete len:100 (+) Transcript_56239:2-301(+)